MGNASVVRRASWTSLVFLMGLTCGVMFSTFWQPQPPPQAAASMVAEPVVEPTPPPLQLFETHLPLQAYNQRSYVDRCIGSTPSNELPRYSLTCFTNLELLENGHGPYKSALPTKILMAIPVGPKGVSNVAKLVERFGFEKFSYIFFLYDPTASFSDYSWKDRIVTVAAKGQQKWWFAKRFLTPQLVSGYSHLMYWDEDIGVDEFDVELYFRIVREYNIDISQPSRNCMYPRQGSYKHICQTMLGPNHHGRYTPLVEVMTPVLTSQAWSCMWPYLQNDSGSGWGYDYHWCQLCASPLSIATIDATAIIHNDLQSWKSASNNRINLAEIEAGVFEARLKNDFNQHSLQRCDIAAMGQAF